MGVVGKLNNQQNFDGKITMIRKSRPHKLQRDTYYHNFRHDHHVNHLIKTNWQELHIDNFTFTELKEVILDTYKINEDIPDSICFHFINHIEINRRIVYIKMRNNKTIENSKKGKR